MSHKPFTLHPRDRARLLKDRFARLAVTTGGLSVLAALGLIFFYLLIEVAPIFSSGTIRFEDSSELSTTPAALRVDDYGEYAFAVSRSGEVDFIELATGNSKIVVTPAGDPVAMAQMPLSSGWIAFAGDNGQISAFRPQFAARYGDQGRSVSPKISYFNAGSLVALGNQGSVIRQFAFAIQGQDSAFLGVDQNGTIHSRTERDARVVRDHWGARIGDVRSLAMTPDASQAFILTGEGLWVAVLQSGRFQVREFIDLTSQPGRQLALLPGAQSLLITHEDGQVSQWFDVLKDKKRTLNRIRSFDTSEGLLLPGYYRKGFYLFESGGAIASVHATSDSVLQENNLLTKAPSVAAVSANEDVLLAYSDGRLFRFEADIPHQEISLRSLWREVWYEGYPEPQYVWQSTSASDDFEEKFSLVPITFGTIKAAMYAMLFAMPVAVLAAVYTAYFMSAPMRRVVKPAIEFMEALPTVIIGFLAGLWLAPIVENHLPAVLLLMLLLPLTTVVVGALWHALPRDWVSGIPNGWHSIILIPALLGVSMLAIHFSASVEQLWFGGDIRVFLADKGIDFDQRNALVVGIAMGFAVIPTIFSIAEDAIFSVPKHLTDGSLALGATHWQTLTRVVLLTASPGIFSAVMMGLGRAVGETMIVLMATGNTPLMEWNMFEGMRSLSATIAIELPESEVASSHYRLLFLAALILFMFTFLVNSLAEWVRQRLREKYSAL